MEEGREKQQKQEYMNVKEMTKIGMMVAVLCVITCRYLEIKELLHLRTKK